MRFQTPLVRARLKRRYKRFLSDVVLDDGTEVVAHCPNPGSMTGLAEPGTQCWLEPNDDPKKKLKYGWRLVELPGRQFVCVDTGIANRVVGEALRAGHVPELAAYDTVTAEVKYGAASRVDFLLRGVGLPDAYVEVKSVTLNRTGDLAEFPDAVTKRGARHLADLSDMVAAGHRGVMFYLVQRTDCTRFDLARDIDPAYAAAFRTARAAGVEVVCRAARIGSGEIVVGGPVGMTAEPATASGSFSGSRL